jgi:uncharacterized membrane protein
MPPDEGSGPTSEPGPQGHNLSWVLLAGLCLAALVILDRWVSLPRLAAMTVHVIRVPLGLAYLLFVPGYCLTAALFPARDDIDRLERVGLSLGLSIAWLPVLALILAQLPRGLSLWPILLGELTSAMLFLALAAWRRGRLPSGIRFTAGRWRPIPWWRALRAADRQIYLFCAVAILLAGLALVWTLLIPSPNRYMTEFYVLGPTGQAVDYPRQAVVGQPVTVTVGIVNREGVRCTYRVQLTAAGQQLFATPPIVLQNEQAWEQPAHYALSRAGDSQPVQLLLYRDDGTEPYRILRLWMDVAEGGEP